MTSPTPSPRPAALVEAMAEAALTAKRKQRYTPLNDETDLASFRDIISAALTAAHTAGFCLIPRAELEEAAEALERADKDSWPTNVYTDLANRLRQRSRG